MKFDPNSYTRAEAGDIIANEGPRVLAVMERAIGSKQASDEPTASRGRVEALIKGELDAAGRASTEVNALNAKLGAASIGAHAARLGMTPEAFHAEHGFSVGNGEVRTAGEALDQALRSKEWVQAASAAHSGQLKHGFTKFGETPALLRNAGLDDGPISMGHGKIGEVAKKHSHIPVGVLHALPELLDNPRAVFPNDNKDHPGSKVVVLNAKDSAGNPILAIVGPKGARGNIVLSLHSKTSEGGITGEQNIARKIAAAKERGEQVYERGNTSPVANESATIADSGPVRQKKPILSVGKKGKPYALDQEARGQFIPETNTIHLLKDADLSTFIHELGH